MSEEAASAPPVIAENGEKSADDETIKKMSEVKISESSESTQQPAESEQDARSDNARENGDDGFHTPEATDEGAKEAAEGRYYMHDSRDADEEVEEDKKISRADGTWKHDRFDERWQRPKTKKQIMTRYGFDIREGETQEEAEQRKRSEDAKKEVARDGESTGVKRRLKREIRPKPRQRSERIGEAVAKPRPQKPVAVKPERQSVEEKSSHGNSDERVTSERRVNDDDDDDLHVGQRRQIRSEHRRDRNERVDVRVVRNVRGSRGGIGAHRMDRHHAGA
ncbi:CASC3/Barentsz eIF4AIII binding protein [Ostertagia ostertagi]